MIKTPKINNYFYWILCVSIVGMFILERPYRNYVPVFFGLLTFPVFIFLFYKSLYAFSSKLRAAYPELFQKYVLRNGISLNRGAVIAVPNLFNNEDFDALEKDDLHAMYLLSKQLFRLMLLCFALFPLFAIATIYL